MTKVSTISFGKKKKRRRLRHLQIANPIVRGRDQRVIARAFEDRTKMCENSGDVSGYNLFISHDSGSLQSRVDDVIKYLRHSQGSCEQVMETDLEDCERLRTY